MGYSPGKLAMSLVLVDGLVIYTLLGLMGPYLIGRGHRPLYYSWQRQSRAGTTARCWMLVVYGAVNSASRPQAG